MPSPFPGMDPYLENPARWPDFHHELISALKHALMRKIRPRYVARADERVYVAEDEEPAFVPDVAVLGPREAPRFGAVEGVPVPLAIPTVVASEHRERFLTIRARGRPEAVVTVIEVLSPTNKRGDASEGRKAYLEKRRSVLKSRTHLVEIDLLRAGQRVPMAAPLPDAPYFVIVSRRPGRPMCDVFPIQLRQKLPAIPIPLEGDEAVAIDLQELLDSVYDESGYDIDVDYSRDPEPPLAGEDATWVRERAREARTRET